MGSGILTSVLVLAGILVFTIGLLRIIKFFFDASPYTR